MALTTKTFKDFVDGQITAAQGSVANIIDFAIGSLLRALFESNAGVAAFLQRQIVELLAKTRAATSTGDDLKSFVADFKLDPPPFEDTSSTGTLTFARFTSTTQALIPVGSLAQTTVGDKFIVTANVGLPAYSESLNAYVLDIGISTMDVLAASLNTGTSPNALAGTITQIAQALPGIDTVTNAAAFTGGSTGESDEAIRIRFVKWVASLTKGTLDAVRYAASSFSSTINVKVVENLSYVDTAQPGYFYVVADNGSTALSGGDLSIIYALVDAVRPITSTFAIFAAVELTANINAVLQLKSGYLLANVSPVVNSAIVSHISSLKIGEELRYARLYQVILNASIGIDNVSSLLLNGGSADIVANDKQTVIAGTVTIS